MTGNKDHDQSNKINNNINNKEIKLNNIKVGERKYSQKEIEELLSDKDREDFIPTPTLSYKINFKDNIHFRIMKKQIDLEYNEIDLYLPDREDLYFHISPSNVYAIKISLKGIKTEMKHEIFIGRPFRVIFFRESNDYLIYWRLMEDIYLIKGKPLEIYRELEKRGFISYSKAKELFFQFLYALVYRGFAIVLDREFLYGDGIFLNKKNLVLVNFKGLPYLQPHNIIGDLQYSLVVLDDLSYYFDMRIFKTIVCYTVASAFSFIIRKEFHPFPFLILQGRKSMGKSTLVKLATSIWYGESTDGEKNPMTPAQFHRSLSETTLPIVLNDIDKLIGEEPKISQELKNIFENVELKEYAHTKEKFYSLSMPIFTTNKLIPLDPAIRRRTYLIKLDEDIRRCEELWDIEKPFLKFKYLNVIGRYILYLVKMNRINVELLKEDPLKIGEEIFKILHKDAMFLRTPEWTTKSFYYTSSKEMEKEEEDNVIEHMKALIKKEIKPRGFNKEEIITAIKQGRFTHVFGLPNNEEVGISTYILKELEKLGITSLKELEDLLKDEYKVYRKLKGKNRRMYLTFDYDSFIDFMGW